MTRTPMTGRALRGGERTGSYVTWRVLTHSQLREQPLRILATLLAIALGVALGSAVYLINTAALSEFDLATRRLVGNADLLVRGPPQGFDEALLVKLAHLPAVSIASPVLELELTVPGDAAPLKVLGIDMFRRRLAAAAAVGRVGGRCHAAVRSGYDRTVGAAAQALRLQRGDSLQALVGGARRSLRVIDVLSDEVYPQALGLMDIASAQWSLGQIGHLNRIDLRLRKGADPEALRAQLEKILPQGSWCAPPRSSARARSARRVPIGSISICWRWWR